MTTPSYSDSDSDHDSPFDVMTRDEPEGQYDGPFHAYLRYDEETEEKGEPHVLREIPVEGRIVRVPPRYHPRRILYILIVDECTNQACRTLTGPFPEKGNCAFQF